MEVVLDACPLCAASSEFTSDGPPAESEASEYLVTCPAGCGEYTITFDALAEVRAWRAVNPSRVQRLLDYVRSQDRRIAIDKTFLRQQR